jgi:hypothetical protein
MEYDINGFFNNSKNFVNFLTNKKNLKKFNKIVVKFNLPTKKQTLIKYFEDSNNFDNFLKNEEIIFEIFLKDKTILKQLEKDTMLANNFIENTDIFPPIGIDSLNTIGKIIDFSDENIELVKLKINMFNDPEPFNNYILNKIGESGFCLSENELSKSRIWMIQPYLGMSSEFKNNKENEQHLYHIGIDIVKPFNTEIYAPLDGKVIVVRLDNDRGGFGSVMILEHKFGDIKFYTLWGHLNKNRLLDIGTIVKKSNIIGYIGDFRDNRNGCYHFHFQAFANKFLLNLFLENGYCPKKYIDKYKKILMNSKFFLRNEYNKVNNDNIIIDKNYIAYNKKLTEKELFLNENPIYLPSLDNSILEYEKYILNDNFLETILDDKFVKYLEKEQNNFLNGRIYLEYDKIKKNNNQQLDKIKYDEIKTNSINIKNKKLLISMKMIFIKRLRNIYKNIKLSKIK